MFLENLKLLMRWLKLKFLPMNSKKFLNNKKMLQNKNKKFRINNNYKHFKIKVLKNQLQEQVIPV
jgi:hypothetical protein